MKTYVSIPSGVETYFRCLYPSEEIYLGHDPEDRHVGSGGAVKYLAKVAERTEKVIIINAGGEGRRLPAYNGYGKVLVPIPVAKWSRGQRITQRLFDLQRDYLTRLSRKASEHLRYVVASGDVLLTLPEVLPPMPEVDVLLVGVWSDSDTMGKHGVFLCDPNDPRYYEGMLQKPSSQELERLGKSHLTLLDTGTWILSEKALNYLMSIPDPVDLYTDLAPFPDDLRVAVYPLEDAEFYHFGSSKDLITSVYKYQNRVLDQRRLFSQRWKLHPSTFLLNSNLDGELTEKNNRFTWIENSYIPSTWTLSDHHIITGVPRNHLTLSLSQGVCLDLVPIRNKGTYAVKVYQFEETFKSNSFWGRVIEGDIYEAPLIPEIKDLEELPILIESVIQGDAKGVYSLKELSALTDWEKIERQRQEFFKENLVTMQTNWDQSVFYHSDLMDVAPLFDGKPIALPNDVPHIVRMQDSAFRAEMGIEANHQSASLILSKLLEDTLDNKRIHPYRNIFADQLIWSRSPVRVDLAGGWTDTPPFCNFEGGSVVNLAVTLNGQEPIQVFVKPRPDEAITINSIDLGETEEIRDFECLRNYMQVGSPFSIPKAALRLCGVGTSDQSDWRELIDQIGGGLEITLFSAVPAGSGLGTSSILGATALSALSEYFGLAWDKNEVCKRTLVLEQMLTTGGGWQDQYGGIYGGAKIVHSTPGILQSPTVHWLPDQVFTDQDTHILYYTGITRRAKDILIRIKDKMMLNEHDTLEAVRHIKALGWEMSEAISKGEYERMGQLLKESWETNKVLDRGSSSPEIEQIISSIKDLAFGYKLTGAGGGGFLYIQAKESEAAKVIKQRLTDKSRGTARLVQMTISAEGCRTTRS